MNKPDIDELMAHVNAFLLPLRAGEGYSRARFDDLCAAIRKCHEALRDAPEIPKVLASIYIDLPGAVDACSTMYEGTTRDDVVSAAGYLLQAIQEGL